VITKRISKLSAVTRSSFAEWWAWTARPAALRDLWHGSKVDRSRVPGDAKALRILWSISNGTDRLVLLVLVLVAPTWLQLPLRAVARRPTRRYGLYVAVAALLVALSLSE
jgi:hypothetical protein